MAKKRQGVVKEYSSAKKTGVILAEKTAYLFHASDLLYELELPDIKPKATVSFLPEKMQQHLYARDIEISVPPGMQRYNLPDKFLTTRQLGFDDWETLERSIKKVQAASRSSYEAALKDLVDQARAVKANALLDLNKFQNKQGEYVQSATFAVVAKPAHNGPYLGKDLVGINRRLRGQSTVPTSWILGGVAMVIGIIILGVGLFLLL